MIHAKDPRVILLSLLRIRKMMNDWFPHRLFVLSKPSSRVLSGNDPVGGRYFKFSCNMSSLFPSHPSVWWQCSCKPLPRPPPAWRGPVPGPGLCEGSLSAEWREWSGDYLPSVRLSQARTGWVGVQYSVCVISSPTARSEHHVNLADETIAQHLDRHGG